MNIILKKAEVKDADILHNLKVESFLPLLRVYEDFDTSPATEYLNKIVSQIKHPQTDYYLINYKGIDIGGIRIVKAFDNSHRVAPIFLLPKFHNLGIAQEVFKQIEKIYNHASSWQLDTILEESNLCYLYEKIGYIKTGKTKILKDKFTIVFYEKIIS